MHFSRTPLGCPAHGYWRTAMGPTAWRWRFQKARPEGSPISASSSKRPRHRAWCSELSSVVGCAGSTWHPREIPHNSRCQMDTSGIYPHQRMMSSPGTPRRFPAVLSSEAIGGEADILQKSSAYWSDVNDPKRTLPRSKSRSAADPVKVCYPLSRYGRGRARVSIQNDSGLAQGLGDRSGGG